MSFNHPPYPGFKLHYPGKETKCDGGTMPDRLHGLVKTIVGSFPIEDPHTQQQQQQRIINLRLVDHTKPFSPVDHMGPQLIVKEQVWKNIVPPAMVGRHHVLPLLANPMEGVLGNLQNSPQRFNKQKRRGELPRSLLGNVPTQTTGYTLHC